MRYEEYGEFDFGKVIGTFDDLGKIGMLCWPVSYHAQEELIAIHAPVGTQSLLGENKAKLIVSGFATSLAACLSFLVDIQKRCSQDECEARHTFGGSGNLRTNLGKILGRIGLGQQPDTATSGPISFDILLKAIKGHPEQYPILMTQALCCLGTKDRSDADEIVSMIKGSDLPEDLRALVDRSLTDWVRLILGHKDPECVLLMLGFRASGGGKPAGLALLEAARITDGVVSTMGGTGEPLYEFLKREFQGRVGFTIHPSHMTDKHLRIYLASDEAKKVTGWVQQLGFPPLP